MRTTLVNLHPTLIIPPIPEKHSMADYAAKPTKAKEDTSIIDLRKRMLAVFLNRCRKMDEVREDGVWWRFLDPNASWVCTPRFCSCGFTKMEIERSVAFTSSSIHTQEYHESSPSRPIQSYTCTSVASHPRFICQIEDDFQGVCHWHTNFSTGSFLHGFFCSPHNPRPSNFWPLPPYFTKSL